MKELLSNAKVALSALGYTKSGRKFYRIDSGVYKLIDFQPGAHGDYFFVNLAVHPIGLPLLKTERLLIPEMPADHECILRRRLDAIPGCSVRNLFRSSLVSSSDSVAVEQIIGAVATEGVQWLDQWGNYSELSSASDEELQPMLTVVPILKSKAIAMLRCFVNQCLGNVPDAQQWFEEYIKSPKDNFNFQLVDGYLKSLCFSSP